MARGNPSAIPRVFLDSGVLLEGLLASPWTYFARTILNTLRRDRIRTAREALHGVEDNLLELLASDSRLANDIINAYSTLLRLLSPEFIPMPIKQEVDRHRHLIRHQTDVPVLVSALKAAPDWFLTTNTRHFTRQVALRTQLKILTPQQFITSIRVLS
jgi:hypothetical protein